jgi:enamine deaminase RidA (YjgF/YER057c/UK114 family)
MSLVVVDPEAPGPASGFSHGLVVSLERCLFVSGQVASDSRGHVAAAPLQVQFARTIDNVLSVAHEAGAGAEQVVSVTAYITDMAAYRQARPALALVWRARFGRHLPAMTLVGVAALIEPLALVEMSAVISLPQAAGR